MSPRLTLANTKLPPKTDSQTTPTNSFSDSCIIMVMCTVVYSYLQHFLIYCFIIGSLYFLPIVLYIMRTLVDGFRKIVRHHRCMDSKTGHYISTAAYRASLSSHGTATERSENATSTAQVHITTPTGSIPKARIN